MSSLLFRCFCPVWSGSNTEVIGGVDSQGTYTPNPRGLSSLATGTTEHESAALWLPG